MESNTLLKGMTYEEYDTAGKELRSLRSGMLRPILESPRHLLAKMQEEKKESEALRQGKIIHQLFENPEKFMDSYMIEPIFEGRTQKGELTTNPNCKEVRAAKADWYARIKPGAIVLTADDVDLVNGIWASLQNKKLIRNILKDGVNETSLFTTDAVTGVPLACRPDFVSARGHVIDLKTTVSAGEPYFMRQIFSNSSMSQWYVLQAAHYAHCLKMAGVGSGEMFTFIAIEKSPPYEMNVFPLDIGCLGIGDQWRQIATERYYECLSSGKWAGYDDRAIAVTVPQWASVPFEEET